MTTSLFDSGERVVDIEISDRMEQAFLDYSMSVLVGRALPDVRDGLKPVQRRILYAMAEAGLRPDRPFRKCASVVGDVMKKYHPHGDSSIYDALVRMAQDFSTREPLVQGHGNFGSVDGDSAAAMRYTEARLSPLAMDLLEGVEEDAVDLVPNYDGYEREPAVLPSRVPNLLVNGASGIAVGMATNVPPHNLGEAIDACRRLLARPQTTVDELMALMPAPDFPTGARIIEGPGIRDAYLTGRGAITMEAVAATETRSGGLPRIVVTELPYQVNKAVLLERIAELVRTRKLDAIRDLRDETSLEGMRVVLELKRGEDPSAVLARLCELTDLRVNFNANIVALVDGQPRTIGLREALDAYLAHQRQVLTRRSAFRRARAAARAHVLQGLFRALDVIDQVIAIIRGADSPDQARAALMERFALSEIQATAILDMQLRRLAALERAKLAQELEGLQATIAGLDEVLGDPSALDRMLDAELAELRRQHATPRRSRLIGRPVTTGEGEPAEVSAPVLDAQPVTLSVSAGGVLRAAGQRRTTDEHDAPGDPLGAVLRSTGRGPVLLVDADGGGYRLRVEDVPVLTARQRGVSLAQLIGASPGARVAGAVNLSGGAFVVTLSAAGLVKRTALAEYQGRARVLIAAGVRDDDRIVAVAMCDEDDHLLLAHDGGLVLRCPAADVRPVGRAALGVAGLQVPRGAEVVALSVVPSGDDSDRMVVTLSREGAVKRTPLAEYPIQGRGGKGVQTGAGSVAWCGLAGDLHVPTAERWVVVRGELAGVARRSQRPGTEGASPPVTGAVVPEQA
jgi:DNA gyrase subunit A